MLLWLLAQTIEDYQKKLEEINKLIAENQRKIEELQREEKNVLFEIAELTKRIELYNQKLELLKNQIQSSWDEIHILNKRKQAIFEDIQRTREKLNKALRLLYKLPKNNMLELILRTGSFYQSYRFEISLMSILKYYKTLANELREKQRELGITEQELNKKLKLLEISLKEQENTLIELQKLRNQRQAYLNRIRVNKIQRQAYLNELEKSRQKLENIIAGLSKKKETIKRSSNLSLLIPANGQIVNDFGYIYDNVYGTRVKNSGIDIKAPRNSPVRAAESGDVVYVGFIEGYGNIIILEHAGFYTIYSQVVGISVKKGDKVIKGQQIAKVGDDPLHFELRIGKEAVDPKPYFTSQF